MLNNDEEINTHRTQAFEEQRSLREQFSNKIKQCSFVAGRRESKENEANKGERRYQSINQSVNPVSSENGSFPVPT